MSLILLHRLKFSIRNDILTLFFLFLLYTTLIKSNVIRAESSSRSSSSSATTLNIHTKYTRELPSLSPPPAYTSNFGTGNKVYDIGNIYHQIFHVNEMNRYRNENIRWRKIDAGGEPLERRAKRDIHNSNVNNNNDNNDAANIVQSFEMKQLIAKQNSTKIVNFSNNNLNKTLEFSNLIDINTELNNSLSDILVLNLSQNNIKLMNTSVVNAFKNVIVLDVSHNQFELFTSAFDKLTALNLTDNQLNGFSSEHLRNLKQLDLSCNAISEPNQLNLNQSNDLEYIDLSCNDLSEMHLTLFQHKTNLKLVNLAGNRLTKIRKNYFFNLINIGILLLSNNDISDIENDTFVYLPNLQYLDLSYNKLDAFSIRALQGIPDLIGLSVAYNQALGNALQGFVASWSLKELDASGTGLCQIPAALAQSVHTLNLSDNHFQVIRCGDLDSYPLLQHLDVSSCQIMDIEDDALGRLEILISLHLNNNNLTRIPLSLPTHLVNLYLQNNRITDIHPQNFAQLTNLEVINLSGNKLTYLPGLPLPRLRSLNLRSAFIKGLSQSVVKMSPNLKDLFLDENPIKCTELLSIAEWATPCRTEKSYDSDMDIERNVNLGIMSISLYRSQCTCHQKHSMRQTFVRNSHCAREHLTSSDNSHSVKSRPILINDNKTTLKNHFDGSMAMQPTNSSVQNETTESSLNEMIISTIGSKLNRQTTNTIANSLPILQKHYAGNVNASDAKINRQEQVNASETPANLHEIQNQTLFNENMHETKSTLFKVENKLNNDNQRTPLPNIDIVKNKSNGNSNSKNNSNQDTVPNDDITFSTVTTTAAQIHSNNGFTDNDDATTSLSSLSSNNPSESLLKLNFKKNKTIATAQQYSTNPKNDTIQALVIKNDKQRNSHQSTNQSSHRHQQPVQSFVQQNKVNSIKVKQSAGNNDSFEKNKLQKIATLKLQDQKVENRSNQQPENQQKIKEKQPQKDDVLNEKRNKFEKLNTKLDKYEANSSFIAAQTMTSQNNKITQLNRAQQIATRVPLNTTKEQNHLIDTVTPAKKNETNEQKHDQHHQMRDDVNGNDKKDDPLNWHTNKAISNVSNNNTNSSRNPNPNPNLNRRKSLRPSVIVNGANANSKKKITTDIYAMERVQTNDDSHTLNHTQKLKEKEISLKSNENSSSSVTANNSPDHYETNDEIYFDRNYVGINDKLNANLNGQIKDNKATESNSNKVTATITASPPPPSPLPQLKINSHRNTTPTLNIQNVNGVTNQRNILNGRRKTKKIKSKQQNTNGNADNTKCAKNNNDNRKNCENDISNGKKMNFESKMSIIADADANNFNHDKNKFNHPKHTDGTLVDQKTFTETHLKNGNKMSMSMAEQLTEENLITTPAATLSDEPVKLSDDAFSYNASDKTYLKKANTFRINVPIPTSTHINNVQMKLPNTTNAIATDNNNLNDENDLNINSSSSNNNNSNNNISSNTSTLSGLSEQWNDIRSTPSGHPGLFIVIGVTIGMFASICLIHLYRCKEPYNRQRNYLEDNDNHEQNTVSSRNLLPMEVLNSEIRYTDTPIDLW